MRRLALVAAIGAALQACQFPWALRPERNSWGLEPEGVGVVVTSDQLGPSTEAKSVSQNLEIRGVDAARVAITQADLIIGERTIVGEVQRWKVLKQERVTYTISWELEERAQTALGDQCVIVLHFEGGSRIEAPYRRFRPPP